MMSTMTDAWHTLAPPAGDEHGPLSPLLLTLTVVTGLMDAFSYLVLGHVFVANMTGNVVFLAFALVGAKGFSIAPHLLAAASFVLGALASGRLVARLGGRRGRILAATTACEAALVAASSAIGLGVGNPDSGSARYMLIVLLAITGGAADRHRAQTGGARPHHHRAHPDHRRCSLRQPTGRWRQLAGRATRAVGRGHVRRCSGRRLPGAPRQQATGSAGRPDAPCPCHGGRRQTLEVAPGLGSGVLNGQSTVGPASWAGDSRRMGIPRGRGAGSSDSPRAGSDGHNRPEGRGLIVNSDRAVETSADLLADVGEHVLAEGGARRLGLAQPGQPEDVLDGGEGRIVVVGHARRRATPDERGDQDGTGAASARPASPGLAAVGPGV